MIIELISKPTVAEPAGSLDHAMEIQDEASLVEHDLPSTFWEVEQGDTQVADVQGRLKINIDFWENELDPAPWIIDCIREGYKLPLHNLPDKFIQPNQRSAKNLYPRLWSGIGA